MKNIYILSPSFYATGGTELLHQLHLFFRGNGQKSHIYYFDANGESDYDKIINPRFSKYIQDYSSEVVFELPDDKDSVVIVAEVFTNHVFQYKKIQKILWWLSVDNFFKPFPQGKEIVDGYTFFDKIVRKNLRKWPYNHIHQKNISLHLYQCEYINDFLTSLLIKKKMPLSDYINLDVCSEKQDLNLKENIILYNPKKGAEVIKDLIEINSKYVWIPLEQLTISELKEYFLRAKLYIDFGNHPGKDRIPREAALNNCCVITNRKGSAKNDVDVPIDDIYKFTDPIKEAEAFFSLVDDIFRNYKEHLVNFNSYKEKILMEKNVFENEARMFMDYLMK